MLYDISFLWIWLTLALLLGVIVGWWTEASGAPAPWFFGWFRQALIAWLIGVVVAWLHWLPGRLGLWLETALLFFAFYVLGCLLGGLLRSLFVSPKAAGGGLMAERAWPFRVGEGGSPFAGWTSRVESGASTPIAPRASAVVSNAVGQRQTSAGAIAVTAPNAHGVVSDAAGASGVTATAMAAIPTEPAALGAVEGEDQHEGQRPPGLVAPRGGVRDDLKHIRGIGHQNEGRLHALGIWHFQQIADWTHENVCWTGSYLAFPGRIDREDWIGQAKDLAKGLETEFSKRVERGDVATSRDGGTEGQDNIADISKLKPPNQDPF